MVAPDTLSVTLLATAACVAVAHTALGPDHFLPFVMLSRARGWSRSRTLAITAACGVGHVGSSLVIALAGVALGAGMGALEEARGQLAAWAMVAFGVAYGLWGLRRTVRARRGIALHEHHGHVHVHGGGGGHHHHVHGTSERGTTFWALFVVFVLGPCEPLLPLFLVPASQGRWALAGAVAIVFSAATLATMLLLVGLAQTGLARLSWGRLEAYTHPLAGATIAASGLAVLFLGL